MLLYKLRFALKYLCKENVTKISCFEALPQDYRIVWVGSDLKDHPLCHRQGHLQLNCAAASCVQPGQVRSTSIKNKVYCL